jgi:tetratricopeptide (TPR) repeat protein
MALAGARVYVHGRLRGLTQRRIVQLVKAAGARPTRAGATATLVVVGHSTAGSTLSDTGDLALRFNPAKAKFVSERNFKARVGIGTLAREIERPYSGEQLQRLAGLGTPQLRGLALYDVLDPVDDRFPYADLVVARAIKRLLSGGAGLGKIAAAALALEQRGMSLSHVRLSEAPWGEILQEVDGGLARLDGQLFLPIESEDISADDAFATAEASEAERDWAAAERWYDLAARLDRGDPVIPFNLGNVLDARGRPLEAEIAYRRAIGRAPDFADAWFNLGVLQERIGRQAEALASYEQAYLVEPAYADALHNAAVLLMRLRRFGKALALWDAILALSPPNAAEVKRLAHLCRLELNNAASR